MSLKQFHIIFIVASILLSGFFAVWSFVQLQTAFNLTYVITGILAAAGAVGLIAYEIAFIKKTSAIS